MTEAYDGRQVVGMDLHRRRSVLVRMTGDGRRLETIRIDNSPAALRAVLARAGSNPRVVAGATYGWYWAADTLAAAGADVHLAHPLGVRAFSCRRVKNDEKDAADLAGLLRLGRLPGARVRPAAGPRAAGADPVPDQAGAAAVLGQGPGARGAGQAGHPGALPGPVRRLRAGVAGGLQLPQPYAGKAGSLRQLTGWLTGEISLLDVVIAGLPGGCPPYRAVRRLPGIGPVLAAVTVAEIGDVSRFPAPGQLCSRSGLAPRHRESGLKVARGHITKQGSPVLRWAMTEAIQHQPAGSPPRELRDRITARRGSQARNIAKTAAARKLLTCVFYAMRDGEVRSLAAPARALQAG